MARAACARRTDYGNRPVRQFLTAGRLGIYTMDRPVFVYEWHSMAGLCRHRTIKGIGPLFFTRLWHRIETRTYLPAMESVRRRLISSAVVMTAGILSALPFYRDKPESAPASEPPSIKTPDSETPSNRALHVPASDLSSTVVTSETAQFVFATDVTTIPSLKREPKSRGNSAIPQLPNKLPRAQETVPPAAPVRRVAEDLRRMQDTSTAPADENAESQRMHWIKDGDTLEEIAFRFLGDRTRWNEILQSNRDLLTDKDVLPIGKQIRIPRRDLPSHPGGGLVPIQWGESL
jgi:hypothetical protein